MSKIRILPEQLANRIAAGEVVERPASVVKELLENSLDAGASDIEIEIEGSGTRLIRVMDNGEGMDEDDLLLCLERHGTSKLTSDHDLAAINSLGFRGEAIPSIGSVSRMTITSRTPESPLGAKVTLDYGKLIKVHEIGCSRGTIFEIRNLFGNTPARRKFLRTSRTEQAHIEEVVKNYALAAPAVSFILRIDDRVVCHFTKNQPLPARLAQIMHYQGRFLEVGKAPDEDKLQTCGHLVATSCPPAVHGWLLPPDAHTASSSTQIRLLVNGRAVRDRMIIHAVTEGFRNFLMKGKSPAGLIHLLLPAEDIDVNVHPTKQEIRLRDSQAIHQMISQTVEQALHQYQKEIQGIIFRSAPMPSNKTEQVATISLSVSDSTGPQSTIEPFPVSPYLSPVPASRRQEAHQQQSLIHPQTAHTQQSTSPPASLPQTAEPVLQEAPFPLQTDPLTHQPLTETRDKGHGLKVIGQYDNLYIFCQSAEGGLLVVDQHAAHERLLFEDLKKKFLQDNVASQALLFPVTVELSIAESECVEHHGADIKQMGFTVRDFGGKSYVISAVPAMAGQCNPGELFRDILGRFVEGNSTKEKTRKGSILDDILASIACKAAVKAGDHLHAREIDALLTRMSRADLFSHCPHGRPVTKHFTTTEIKKWFYRP
jgi:DNA mismatch repair protein MutL